MSQDWDEAEALRASLREHMAEIHRLRAAGRQALEALEEYQQKGAPFMSCDAAVETLRAALAEDVPETNFGNMAQEVDLKRDDILRMARECFADPDGSLVLLTPELTQFAALVAAAEREACAKVCDELHDKIELVEKTEHYPGEYGSEYDAGQGNAICECADAIRARGEE